MKITRIVAGIAATLIGTSSLVLIAVPASAHTPSVSADCQTLTVNAQYYDTKPSTTDRVRVSEEIPAVPPTYEDVIVEDGYTEYEFKHERNGKTRWEREGWNADSNPQSLGWYSTGNTRTIDPIYEQVETNPGSPAIPAVYEDVTIPGDDTPNTVNVTIDGSSVESTEFGHSFSNSYDFGNSYVAHDWTVDIVAWNDANGSKGWSKSFSGTTTPCDAPDEPIVTTGSVTFIDSVCLDGEPTGNSATIDLEPGASASYSLNGGDFQPIAEGTYNDVAPGDYVVEIDSEDGYKLDGESTFTHTFVAPEDCEVVVIPEKPEPLVESSTSNSVDCTTGTYYEQTVTTTTEYVYDAESNTWVLGPHDTNVIDSNRPATETELIDADCPVVVDEPDPVDPPVVDEPETDKPTPAVVTAVGEKSLAVTGADPWPWLALTAILVLIGFAFIIFSRRAPHNQ